MSQSSTQLLPEIRIKDAWLLRENASEYLDKMWRKKDDEPIAHNPDYNKWITAKVASYREAWQPYEQNILSSMCTMLGLNFKQNIVDVYIAPWFYAFSDPMVLGVTFEPDEFVDHLTHELIHRLLSDNLVTSPDFDYIEEWRNLFGTQHSFNALVHIPVHAVHKAIYLDVLKDSKRLEGDVSTLKKNNAADYLKSWEYIEKEGYSEIIDKLRRSYRALSSNPQQIK
jgi:hypothetical protein